MNWGLGIGLAGALAGLIYALFNALWVLRQDCGEQVLQPPFVAIRRAAGAFLETQYVMIFRVGLIVLLGLWFVPGVDLATALGFVLGGCCSAVAGVAGMSVSIRANVRTAAAARAGVGPALRIAVRAGAATGFLVSGLALGCVGGFYLFLLLISSSPHVSLQPMVGLGFGASLVSIFARLGGGIFTKAADVGADMVGKLEHGFPEDDARNPAAIADNVGDNVGDCAGMAADLFESYVVTLLSTMLIASWVFPNVDAARFLPLAAGGVSLLAAIAGTEAIRLPSNQKLMMAFLSGLLITVLLAASGMLVSGFMLLGSVWMMGTGGLVAAMASGIALALGLVGLTVYYTSVEFSPVHRLARASSAGHATNVIAGLALSMKSVAAAAVLVALGVVIAYGAGGVYGLAIATTAMLGLAPIVITIDAFGPVTDNAGGIAEMAGATGAIRQSTDRLDAAGNTTKAVTKAFAIGSAGLAALALFAVYHSEVQRAGFALEFTLNNPYALAGLLIGGVLPFLFSGYALEAVGKAAAEIVSSVRKQFSLHPEILRGERLPDYADIVSSLTRSSLRYMLVPGLVPVATPLLIGFLGPLVMPVAATAQVIGGMLIGAIVTGLFLAISMCTGGAAWDNAKKYIEAGHLGGKGSPAHQAAITGDTVGDPYKDTAGPAINPMIKILNLVALLIVPSWG